MYIYQDLNDVVHMRTISGKELHAFKPGFPSYGEVMTPDLTTYIGSTIDWKIFMIKGANRYVLDKDFDRMSAISAGKIVDFTLRGNNSLLISGCTTSYGPTLWNLKTRKKIFVYKGNVYHTYADLSPNKKYIISGDVNAKVMW